MTANKRFKMKKLEYESYFIDSQQEYVDEDEPNFKIDDERTMSDSQILDLLNENEQLKKENSELKLLVQNWEALDAEKDEQLNRQNQLLKKLKKENLDLSEELDYHKTKCASLETGLFQADKENGRLKKENKKLQDEYDEQLWLYNGLGCEYDSLKEEIKAKDKIIELYYEMVKE